MARLRVIVHGTMQGDEVQNCFAMTFGEASSPSRANDAAVVINQAWESHIMPVVSDNYGKYKVTAQDIDNPTYYAEVADTATGGSTDQPLPGFVTVNMRLLTGLRGRAFNGRTGISGVKISDIDTANPAFLTNTAKGIYEGAAANFQAYVEGASGLTSPRLAVLSTILNGAPRSTPLTTTVTDVDIAQRLGTRRSRND